MILLGVLSRYILIRSKLDYICCISSNQIELTPSHWFVASCSPEAQQQKGHAHFGDSSRPNIPNLDDLYCKTKVTKPNLFTKGLTRIELSILFRALGSQKSIKVNHELLSKVENDHYYE